MKLHIRPSEFLNMEEREKAFTVASIKKKMEADKKEKQRIERQSKRR